MTYVDIDTDISMWTQLYENTTLKQNSYFSIDEGTVVVYNILDAIKYAT